VDLVRYPQEPFLPNEHDIAVYEKTFLIFLLERGKDIAKDDVIALKLKPFILIGCSLPSLNELGSRTGASEVSFSSEALIDSLSLTTHRQGVPTSCISGRISLLFPG
jgi:hypothetical protein